MRSITNIISDLFRDEVGFSSVEVDEELHGEINEVLDSLTDNDGRPLLLVRPPRENEGMDASISVYETLRNPREKKIGVGLFSAIQTEAHAHAHEIWYNKAQMQFFLRPETRVDANKVRRQVRSNYPNVDITEVDSRFPSVDVGEYISVAEIGLKRDFYFPIKAKLHNDDDFELDPYGDITSDMVVEEDETSDGQRVEAKDCKLVVQTVFEAARNVWSESRPYGVDVNDIAQGMKEGEVHGNMLSGFDTPNPSTLRKKAAKILETLQGSKAYYVTMRIVAISPYEEIAERRCRNVAQDFETYYNSITQQGLAPIELTEEEMRESILEVARREHEYGFRDRFLSTGKFVKPVEALGAIAHIPDESINTPVVDWAKQDTGPGTPSSGSQLEDQKRESQKAGDTGRKETLNQISGDTETVESSGAESETQQNSGLDPRSESPTENTAHAGSEETPTPNEDTIDRWRDTDETSADSGVSETTFGGDEPDGLDEADGLDQNTSAGGWGTEQEQQPEPDAEQQPEPDPEIGFGTDDTDTESQGEGDDSDTTPAFASEFENDGWDSTNEDGSNSTQRR